MSWIHHPVFYRRFERGPRYQRRNLHPSLQHAHCSSLSRSDVNFPVLMRLFDYRSSAILFIFGQLIFACVTVLFAPWWTRRCWCPYGRDRCAAGSNWPAVVQKLSWFLLTPKQPRSLPWNLKEKYCFELLGWSLPGRIGVGCWKLPRSWQRMLGSWARPRNY